MLISFRENRLDEDVSIRLFLQQFCSVSNIRPV